MSDLDTFERRLVRELDDATGEIRPDLDAARSGVAARLATRSSTSRAGRSGRGSFLAVAAGLTLIVGAGTFALVRATPDEGQEAAATTSPTTADSLDEAVVGGTDLDGAEADSDELDGTAADSADGSDDESTSGDEASLPDGMAWTDIEPPTNTPTDRSGTRVVAVVSDFDENGPTTIETITASADDGRTFASNIDGELIEQPSPAGPWLNALAANRNADVEIATNAALRATGTDPAQATATTIDSRIWFRTVDAFATASLGDDGWTDAMRAVTAIDDVRIQEVAVDGRRRVEITFHDAPDGGVWALSLDGDTGFPLVANRIDRSGSPSQQIDYTVERFDAPDPNAAPNESLLVVDAPIVVGPLGVEVTAADGSVITAFWGADRSELLDAVTSLIGEPEQWAAQSCEVNPLLAAATWPGVSLFFINDVFVGWFVDGDVDPGVTIASSSGVSIGSSIEQLLELDPEAILDPEGSLGPEFFNGAVSFFATDGSSDGVITDMQSGQTCVAR